MSGFHKHINGGGLVADTAYVEDTAFIGPDAKVFGYAKVFGNARVYGNALVFGYAKVFGKAVISGNAHVYGNARVSGHVKVSGDVSVYGDVKVSKPFPQIKRSDGYDFILVPDKDGIDRIIAGCRYFTVPEAIEHWTKTRYGTKLGTETLKIIRTLQELNKEIK